MSKSLKTADPGPITADSLTDDDPDAHKASAYVWLPDDPRMLALPVNADFNRRIVAFDSDAQWFDTNVSGLQVRLLEWLPGPAPRVSAQLRLKPEVPRCVVLPDTGLEILIQNGTLEHGNHVFDVGWYLRNPVAINRRYPAEFYASMSSGSASDSTVTSSKSSPDSMTTADVKPALMYIAAGEIDDSDTENRSIDTTNNELWFPGPVDDTEVLALHGHGTGNAMLVRWNGSTGFRPRLDPLGEEVLVLAGTLRDSRGEYPANTWIRNPVNEWQTWSGDKGTLIYYKSGHFPKAPSASS